MTKTREEEIAQTIQRVRGEEAFARQMLEAALQEKIKSLKKQVEMLSYITCAKWTILIVILWKILWH
jgi:polyhydroxyalkanoate synthesis regulator phasin